MNPNSVTFANDINNLLTNTTDTQKIVSFATGAAVGRMIPMPASVVEGRDENFEIEVIKKAKELVSKVNELYVLDIDYTLSVIKAIYHTRFNACFPNTITIEEDTCICEDFFGIKTNFKVINLEGLNEYKKEIVTLISKINGVLYD